MESASYGLEVNGETRVKAGRSPGPVQSPAVGFGPDRCREREVADGADTRTGQLVDRGAHQRMAEPDRTGGQFDQRGLDGRAEHGRAVASDSSLRPTKVSTATVAGSIQWMSSATTSSGATAPASASRSRAAIATAYRSGARSGVMPKATFKASRRSAEIALAHGRIGLSS